MFLFGKYKTCFLEKKLYMYVKINLTAMTNFYIFLLISTKYVDNTVTF